jgi:antitoxin Xre/MbcA/ParS-like protein
MEQNVEEALRQNAELLTLTGDEVERIVSGCQSDQKKVAQMLALLYKRLAPKVGADPDAIRHWLYTRNRHLGARPLDLLNQMDGFRETIKYLGALDASQSS